MCVPRCFARCYALVAILTVIGLGAPGSACGQELRLTARTKGKTFDRFAARDGEIVAVVGGTNSPLPLDAEWHLEGDLAAEMDWIAIRPVYDLAREPLFPHRTGPRPLRYQASVYYDYRGREADPAWDPRLVSGAILVVAWVRDGACVSVTADATNPASSSHWVSVKLDLSAAEATGFPIVLLLRDGKFVRPQPFFSDPAVNRAALLAHFGSPDAANAAIAAAPLNHLTGRGGDTLLHVFADSGLTAATRQLLARGVNSYQPGRSALLPIYRAAATGRTDVVAAFLEAGAKPDQAMLDGAPPIWIALRNRHDQTAQLLVTAGANLRYAEGAQSVIELALNECLVGTARAMGLRGGLKAMSRELNERLVDAIEGGATDFALALLELGAKAEQEVHGRTLLGLAAQSEATDLVKGLLRAGANVDRPDPSSATPLMIAAAAGRPSQVSLLLEARANPNARDRVDRTPLEVALATQSHSVVAPLVAAGARIDLKSPRALEQVAAAIQLDFPVLLEEARRTGWNPTLPLAEGVSAAGLARFNGGANSALWLNRIGAPDSALAVAGEIDTPPKIASRAPFDDPRLGDQTYAEETAMISAIVGRDGVLLFPRVQAKDPALIAATVTHLRSWRFSPARKAGAELPVAVTFPLTFPANDRRIFELPEVDEPPHRAGDFGRSNYPTNGNLPDPFDAITELAIQTHAKKLAGASRVAFVVERDGSVGGIEFPPGVGYARGARLRDIVRTFAFTPARRHGEPVRVWLDVVIERDQRVIGLPR